jgi:ribonuclease Z
LGRKKKLEVFAPEGVKEILDVNLKHSNTRLGYELVFHPLEYGYKENVFDDQVFSVSTFPLKHSVPTNGFLFREKPLPRKIKKAFVDEHEDIDYSWFDAIKKGEDFVDPMGRIIPNETITESPPEPRSYAYCSDTAYFEEVKGYVRGVDVLYHEATFTEAFKDAAHEKLHATAREAALVARSAGVKKLVIGHFSARYKEADPLVSEASEIFKETIAAEDGMVIKV